MVNFMFLYGKSTYYTGRVICLQRALDEVVVTCIGTLVWVCKKPFVHVLVVILFYVKTPQYSQDFMILCALARFPKPLEERRSLSITKPLPYTHTPGGMSCFTQF